MSTNQSARDGFGPLLRKLRRMRGISQAELSKRVGVSQGRISFFETGRGRPGRNTAARLIDALALNTGDGNHLLNVLGFAGMPEEAEIDLTDLPPDFDVFIGSLIRTPDPVPAAIFSQRGLYVRMTRTLAMIQAPWAGIDDLYVDGLLSHMRALFHSEGYRTRLEDWEDYAGAVVQGLHRDALRDPQLGQLLYRDATRYGPLPEAWKQLSDAVGISAGFTMAVTTPVGRLVLRNILVTVSAHPAHLATRIPDFFLLKLLPVDADSADKVRQLDALAVKKGVPKRLRPIVVT